MYDEKDIYGLAYQCPVLVRENDCPLAVIDHLSFAEKLKWIKGLSAETKNSMIQHHKICSESRYPHLQTVAVPVEAIKRNTT
jgi:hypothetical protein